MFKLTVIIPTYNKEAYIRECLDSIFMQRTKFPYQIIAADDCSTDKTLDILQEYDQKYPGIITLLTSEKNQKLYKNVLRAYSITKTDYFTVLDPDDYWTDKYKIQKALTFLEENPEYTIHTSNSYQKLRDGQIIPFSAHPERDSDFQNYLMGNPVLGHTSGTVFRNVIFKNGIPEKMLNLPSPSCEVSFRGDSFRNFIHLHEGKAHAIPHYESVYRITDEGIWQGMSEFEQHLVNTQLFLDFWLYYDKKYDQLIIRALIQLNLAEKFLNNFLQLKNKEKIKIKIQKFKELQYLFNQILNTHNINVLQQG